jgi:OmpA-OmpF porin, OOP family
MGFLNYNYFLSKNRSLSAIDYLVKKGVKKSRMKLKAFGYDKPAISNQTQEARQLNRRVEFKVYK